MSNDPILESCGLIKNGEHIYVKVSAQNVIAGDVLADGSVVESNEIVQQHEGRATVVHLITSSGIKVRKANHLVEINPRPARFSDYKTPLRNHPHVIVQGGCVVGGYTTWGYRVQCIGCGEVQEVVHCSSVTHEDGPMWFGHKHRDCRPTERRS